jgi:beta-galactosidase
MKKIFLKNLFLFFLFTAFSAVCYSQHPARKGNNFDFDWKFSLQDVKEAALPDYNDDEWEDVQLPHDWSITLPFKSDPVKGDGQFRHAPACMGFLQGGTGWYRKTFYTSVKDKDKKTTILFDGVYHQCDVYINGKHLGFHPYGYTGFEYDLTPYLKYGEKNTLSVRVDHSNAPSSRWYSGSGIYRHVWLTVTNPVRVATWGTAVTTPQITASSAEVKLVTTIENNTASKKRISLESRIIDAKGNTIASTSFPLNLPEKEQTNVEQQLQVKNPELWTLETPIMYTVLSVIKINGKEADRYETPFGIRTIKIDADQGFFINGKPIKLKGMNLHQDAGALGTAVPDRSYERRLEILKEYGCNAIRCSHNPPSPEFLDFCDRIGFIVIDEAFDKWTSFYYNDYFTEWWKKDMESMLLRDRNHPSVVIWSAGNELEDANDTTGVSTARAKMIVDYIRQTEPTRPVSISLAPAYDQGRPYNRNGFLDVFDLVGYNYMEPKYIADKKAFPKRIIYGTEVFPFYRGNFDNMRDYAPDNPWYDVEKNDFVLGQFLWAGVDYLGESAGLPSKGWSTCPFDVCMFEKPRAAFHRSVWNPQPMVRIAVADQSLNIDPGKDHWSWPNLAEHWNFPQYAGHVIEVQTINNCEEVELWINNKTMGRRKTADYPNNTIVWHVPYKAGQVKAIGYNKGIEVANYELNTTGKPVKIALQADREILASDGQDLAHITVLLLDEKGLVVPDNDLPITFEITGQGKLIGLDNGDLRSDESFKANKRITYFGKALAVVQSSRNSGKIRVKATADGLPESILILNCQSQDIVPVSVIKDYTEKFNRKDNELFADLECFPNTEAFDFLSKNIPRFECPDKTLEEIYYFRWWTYRKHIKKTPEGYVITEFMPNVSWAGKYNAISCPAMLHFNEGRWLCGEEYLNSYAYYWLRGGGSVRSYSFPAAHALYNYFLTTGNDSIIKDLLPDLILNYEAWEQKHFDVDKGLFWQIDDRDGMEISIGGSGYRATINSYMAAEAQAIAKIAKRCGNSEQQQRFEAKAATVKNNLLQTLWDSKAQFFKVMQRGAANPTLCDARELHGYTPWTFDLVDEKYAAAWQFLMDPKHFYAPYGPTTAEQSHPGFAISYEGHECQWNGPSWPLATSITLTGLANLLQTQQQNVISVRDYFDLLGIFARSHSFTQEDGVKVPWIDENLNPFTGDWISRTRLKTYENGTWSEQKGGIERGKDYNHSSFCDLIISGLTGIRPTEGNTLTVHPLLPDGVWEYFCLENVPYHGKKIAVVYDKTGNRYGKGKGLTVWVNGKRIASSPDLAPITGEIY